MFISHVYIQDQDTCTLKNQGSDQHIGFHFSFLYSLNGELCKGLTPLLAKSQRLLICCATLIWSHNCVFCASPNYQFCTNTMTFESILS